MGLTVGAWADILRYMAKYRNDICEVTDVFKALGDENRLRTVVVLLRFGELCVCQITGMLSLAPSTVSKHLSILRRAGLVTCRKKGRWVHYRIDENLQHGFVRQVIDIAAEAISVDATVRDDMGVLKEILKETQEDFCAEQKRHP